MNKIVCIYPKDLATDFLHPLYEHICTTFNAIGVGYDTYSDEDPLELIYHEVEDAHVIFFLGHGMSTCLYASITDNVELFNKNNIALLNGKRLFLLACRSNQFIKECNITNAIGFGFLPTSEEDIEYTRRYHNIDITDTNILDVDYFNRAIVQIFIQSISEETIGDFFLLKERILFNTSKEIVRCLRDKVAPHYRTIADELYYMYKDLIVK